MKRPSVPMYPSFEKCYYYAPNDGIPYHEALIGITFPNSTYEVKRQKGLRLRGLTVNLLEYVVEGEGEIFLNGAWTPVRAGELFVIRSNEDQFYRSNPKNPWKKIWFNYYAGYTDSFLDAFGIHTGIYRNTNMLPLFEKALDTAKDQENYTDACYIIADLFHKIIQTLSLYVTRESATLEFSIRQELDNAIYKKLELEQIAEKLHISKSNVIRSFKRQYGLTPYDYLLDQKVDTAKRLLLTTHLTSKEIAAKLCFSNEHHFSTVFFNRVGIRPKQYRKTEAEQITEHKKIF
ncbi:MAG: helix-turn-helix domain-containing protein [Clostridia bacterium]|nr:helix-turn-helix domain-containing protein [Clostridia bacterium]